MFCTPDNVSKLSVVAEWSTRDPLISAVLSLVLLSASSAVTLRLTFSPCSQSVSAECGTSSSLRLSMRRQAPYRDRRKIAGSQMLLNCAINESHRSGGSDAIRERPYVEDQHRRVAARRRGRRGGG